MKIRPLAVLFTAVLSSLFTFAVEPIAVWESFTGADATSGLSNGSAGLTLLANGNEIAEDGYSIKITQSNGVLVNGFPSGTSAFTVLVKYRNLNLTASATQSLLTCKNSLGDNRLGISLKANNGGIIGQTQANGWEWYGTTNVGNGLENSGTLAFTHSSSSGTYVYAQGVTGTGVSGSIYGARGLSYDGHNYDGIAIGGLRSGTNLAAASDMVIEGIAVFNSVLTKDEIDAYTWPELKTEELVWSNVGEAFSNINGANGVNVNTLTLPVPEGMTAGDMVTLKSVGIVYRGTSYADQITLSDGEKDIVSDLYDSVEAIAGMIHANKQANLVRYTFENVEAPLEVPVGVPLTIKNLSIDAILVQPNTYTVVSQSKYTTYSLVYEVKAEKIPEEISVYTWQNRDTSLNRVKAAYPHLKLRLSANDVFAEGDKVKVTSIKIAGRDDNTSITHYLKVVVDGSEVLSNLRVAEENWQINPTGSTRTADTFTFPETSPLVLTVGKTYVVTALDANGEAIQTGNTFQSGGSTVIQYTSYLDSDLWYDSEVSIDRNYVPIYEIEAEEYEAPFVAPDEFGSTTRVLTTIEMPLENSIPVKYQRQFLKELATRYEITAHLGGNGIYSGSRTLPAQVRYLAFHSDGVLTFEVQTYDSPHTKCAIVGVYFDENGALIFKHLGSAYKNNGYTTDSMFSYANGTATRRSGFNWSNDGYLLQGVNFKRAAKLDTSVVAPEVIANSAVLHYDASNYDNFTFNEDGEVTQWNDISANQNHATPSATTPNDVVKNGRLELVNGIPAFQMGATGSGIDLAFNTRCTALLTAFWVVDIKQSAGAFLLADNLRFPLHRGDAGQFLHSTHAHEGLRTGFVTCDGETINPTTTIPPEGTHVYAMRSSTGAFIAGRLSQDRTTNGRNGGRAISELILFNTKLTDEEIAEVNAYLAAKWGIEPAAPAELIQPGSTTTDRYEFTEGVTVMNWGGNGETQFCENDSAKDPVVKVSERATLKLNGQDYSGWLGSITDTCWFKIDGTLVFLEGSGSRFWRDHLLLGDGAVVKIDHGGRNLLLYGGVGAEDNAQIMLPRGAASIVVGEAGDNAAIHLGNDNSQPYGDKGAGISVGEGATLTIEVPIKGGDPIAKWGEGTLILSGSLASFSGTITLNDGIIKVKNTCSLAAEKIVMEEREGYAANIVNDGTWTTYSYIDAGDKLKYGYSFNGNCEVNFKATGSLGIGDWSSDIFNNALVIGKNAGSHYRNSGFSYGDGDWTILSVVRAPGENEVIYALGGTKTTEGLIGLRNAGNNKIEAFTTSGAEVTSVTLDHNPRLGYHLYAITYCASTGELTMSVDGETFTEPVAFTPGTGVQWQIGGIYGASIAGTHDNASAYRGALDEFRFYERVLSEEELAEFAAEFDLYDPEATVEPIVIDSSEILPSSPPDFGVTYRYEGEKALDTVPFYGSSYDGVIELACPVKDLAEATGRFTGSKGAVVFNEGFSVLNEQARLLLGNNSGVVQNYTQNAGDLVFTGEGDATASGNAAILFAHWPSTVNYYLNGGSITAINGLTRLGWDGNAYVYVGLYGEGDALLKLAGIYENGKNNECGLAIGTHGTLEITSESGIKLTSNKSIASVGGTIKFDESCEVIGGRIGFSGTTNRIDVDSGKTVTIASSIIGEGSIEKTGAGTLVIAGTIADTINIVLAEGSVVVPEEFEATRILPPTGVHPDDKTVVTENGVTTYTFGRPAPGAGEVYRYEGTEPLAYVPFHGVGFEGTVEVACPVMDLALNDGIPGKFKGAKHLVVFDEGFSVVNSQIRMQIGNNNGGNQHFIQKAGTIDCLLDGNGNDQNYMAILFGHWPSENSYTLQGGALIATNGVSALGWDGTIALTVGGGDKDALLKLYGVRGDAKNRNAILTLLQNGTLEITSDYGISLNDAKTIALNGGTLKFDESCEVSLGTITFGEENSSIIEVAEGRTVVISSAVTGSGHVTKIGLGTLKIAEGQPEIEVAEGQVVYLNAPLATITESTSISSLELASDASGVITIQGAESEDAAYTVTFDEEISENVTFTVTGYATIAAAEGIRIANDLTIKTDATLNIEGVVELNETMSLIQEQGSTLVIRPEARLVVNRDNQISNIGIKRVYGTLDLNGHLLALNNDPSCTVINLYAGSIIEHGEFFLDGGFSHTINLSDSDSEDKLVHVNAAFRTSKFGQGFTFKFNADEGVGIVFNGGILNQGDLEFAGSAIFTQPTANLQNVLKGTGSIIVDVGEGNELVFNAVNTFTGGLIVKSGTAKTKNANGYGPNNYFLWETPDALGQIEVKEGATLDLANTINTCYAITTAGTITNSGADIGTGTRQTVKLALSGDTTVSGNTFGLLAAGYQSTILELGEHTLTVAMKEGKQFIIDNATISGTGTIKLKSGSLYLAHALNGTIKLDLSDFTSEGGTVATGNATLLEKIVLAEGQKGWKLTIDGTTLFAEYVAIFDPETDAVATTPVLRFSEIMPKPSDKPNSITTEAGYDKNGLESGWVELENTSETEWADLADYKFIRTNRSKANDKGDYGAFPSVKIPPKSKYVFYTSERYSNSASKADSAFAEGTFDGKPMYFEKYNMMIWGDKINPKKFPFVRLYFKDTTIVDTVVIPSDIPEGNSIIVTPVEEGKATVRYMTNKPTKGTANTALTDESIIKLGPNAGPLYEISTGKKHNSASEFARVAAPAVSTNDYEVVFSMNPTMSPTEVAKFRAEDAIAKIDMIVRTDLDDKTLTTIPVDLTTKTTDAKDWGDSYTATIPKTIFPAAGHLIQWKFEVTDAAGNTWTTPSFHNPDDGYEWYGTIVESEALTSKSLPTWHMFVDAASKAQMDIDTDKQNLSVVPHNARVAIYDSSTSSYYDYVRIDLRGNTSAHFNKKSHGLRFAKAHPLTMWDPVAGEMREEVRKSSLIGEPADPSRMRQMMAFWLWNKMGNKVPFDFPVRCNLNGNFYQLAFHSERFTDELIEDFHKLDKYGYGYKNVGTLASGGKTSAGSIEKKTPDDGNEKDVSVLEDELRAKLAELGIDDLSAKDNAERPAITKFVVEKFNLPAWLNYLASARITQEMDDVWANISIYYDNAQMLEEGAYRGTGTWMPLGYDFNLTFGQWYINDIQGAAKNGTYMVNQDWYKSHPFYGGNVVRCYKQEARTTTCNEGNRGIEAVWQSPKFRRLYLRRLRTLMDQELGAPNTDETLENTKIPVMVRMKEIADLMRADANEDTTKYPWDSSIGNIDIWGSANFPKTMDEGIAEIWTKYIVPRREHLYVTHAAEGHEVEEIGYGTKLCAGIPAAQSLIADLKAGLSAEYDAALGATIIRNTNDETIDLSGWTLGGPVQMTLPAGTVIDEGTAEAPAEVYVTADRRATIAKMKIADQVVVGNGTAGDSEVITLKAGEETVIAPPEPSEQEKYVKLYGFCGQPVEGDDGDGEFIILWNTADHDVDVAGLTISICKSGDLVAKCLVTLPEGTTISAGTYLRLNHADYPKAVGWDKITNGNVDIKLTDLKGVVIYAIDALSQEALGVKGTGSYAKYDWEANAWGADLIENAPGYVAPEPPPVDPVDPPAEGDITGDFDELQTFTAGVYTINGANFNGGVKIDGDVTLTLKGDNTLSTMVTAGTLTIEGEGTLTIDYVDGEAGTAAVTLTKPYIQNGGNVVVNLSSENQVFGFYCNTATKDALGNGIYAVELNGGTFTTTIAGGESSAAFKLGKGSNDAKLGGTDVTVTLGGTAPRFINTDGKIKLTKNCGKVTVTTATEGGTKANVFKSKKEIEINGGTVVATASGEGSEIFSSDDTILVKGGVLSLTAADDCFSAANHINVTGGVVYAMSTAGDAIDSNGDMTISGGYVFAFTTSTEHEALDVDPSEDPTAVDNGIAHKLYINEGATVVAVGGLSTVHGPDDGSSAKCLVKTGLSSSSKYLVMTGIVDDENVRRTTTATVNWNKKHAKTFTLIATMPGFTGEITEGGDEVKPSTGKLADEISGMFVNTVESSIVTPSGATTWEEATEITDDTPMSELVPEMQATTLTNLGVAPTTLAKWAKEHHATGALGTEINLVAFALNCAPTEEAIEEAKENFKVTITMTKEGPVAEIESEYYTITPVIKGKAELSEETWVEKTEENKDSLKFFRAFIELPSEE